MASITTSSVREELDRSKSEFKRLCSEQSISGEITLLISSMLTLLELICAFFLEKSTTKHSKNSSKPSSQTGKDETALGQQGKGQD
jgi:transposase